MFQIICKLNGGQVSFFNVGLILGGLVIASQVRDLGFHLLILGGGLGAVGAIGGGAATFLLLLPFWWLPIIFEFQFPFNRGIHFFLISRIGSG